MIIVATTRPETMLGDTAIAVHPNDERYKVRCLFSSSYKPEQGLTRRRSTFMASLPFILL